jgi:hypothetical protein
LYKRIATIQRFLDLIWQKKLSKLTIFFEMMARNEDALYTKFKKEILQKLDVIDKDSEILG